MERDQQRLMSLLAELGLLSYASTFEQNEITYSDLFTMKDEDFAEVIRPMGPRRKLMSHLENLRQAGQGRQQPQAPPVRHTLSSRYDEMNYGPDDRISGDRRDRSDPRRASELQQRVSSTRARQNQYTSEHDDRYHVPYVEEVEPHYSKGYGDRPRVPPARRPSPPNSGWRYPVLVQGPADFCNEHVFEIFQNYRINIITIGFSDVVNDPALGSSKWARIEFDSPDISHKACSQPITWRGRTIKPQLDSRGGVPPDPRGERPRDRDRDRERRDRPRDRDLDRDRDAWGEDREGGPHAVKLRGLPYKVRYDDIREFFRGLRVVTRGITLEKDENGRPNGDAIVLFESESDVQAALRKHKDAIGHRWVSVSRLSHLPPEISGQDRSRKGLGQMDEEERARSVFVSKLPDEASEQDIRDLLGPFLVKKVDSIRVPREPNGSCKGFGFVRFTDPGAVDELLRIPSPLVLGREVHIRRCESGGELMFGGVGEKERQRESEKPSRSGKEKVRRRDRDVPEWATVNAEGEWDDPRDEPTSDGVGLPWKWDGPRGPDEASMKSLLSAFREPHQRSLDLPGHSLEPFMLAAGTEDTGDAVETGDTGDFDHTVLEHATAVAVGLVDDPVEIVADQLTEVQEIPSEGACLVLIGSSAPPAVVTPEPEVATLPADLPQAVQELPQEPVQDTPQPPPAATDTADAEGTPESPQ
eukprot:TRINITY_DN2414_c0_g1_i1.p1 TRINITY_DN2414_c0_g1~~TRINITY_DN2414_c0_g1_i1.p1  ORF type:complete len:717 (-),score=77.19 TRINITY_DN2414_c0_g1_i1:241-2340(-)